MEQNEEQKRQELSPGIAKSLLECGVCLSLVCEPVSLSCGHTFCRTCLVRTLQRTAKRCPCCRAACHTRCVRLASVFVLWDLLSRLHVPSSSPRRSVLSTLLSLLWLLCTCLCTGRRRRMRCRGAAHASREHNACSARGGRNTGRDGGSLACAVSCLERRYSGLFWPYFWFLIITLHRTLGRLLAFLDDSSLGRLLIPHAANTGDIIFFYTTQMRT